MNRFVIIDGLPYLLHNEKTYGVRWDEKGFTVGTEVKTNAVVPAVTLSELSVKAKYSGRLDSISAQAKEQEEGKEQEEKTVEQAKKTAKDEEVPFSELEKMKFFALKSYAKRNGIEAAHTATKAEILKAIMEARA